VYSKKYIKETGMDMVNEWRGAVCIALCCCGQWIPATVILTLFCSCHYLLTYRLGVESVNLIPGANVTLAVCPNSTLVRCGLVVQQAVQQVLSK